MNPYSKPVLTCYQRPDLGYFSVSNANAECQIDCAGNVCNLVATASAAPCDACDCDVVCPEAIFPASDCWPGDCP